MSPVTTIQPVRRAMSEIFLVLATVLFFACGGSGGGIPASVAISVTPSTASVVAGATQQFNATVTGSSNQAVSWSVQESGGGSVSVAGLYTAPSAAGSFHVVAQSLADTAKSASALVSVTPPPVAISLTPTSATVAVGATQQFTALVTGSTNTAASWSVQESAGGIVSASGLYTAPASGGTFHVIANAAADASKSASAAVSVKPASPVAVTLSLVGGVPSIAWTAPAGATAGLQYQLLRSTDATTFSALGNPVAASPETDPSATAGGPYYYSIESVQGGQASAPVASTPASVTLTPASVNALTAIPGCRTIHLAWQGSGGATTYSVSRIAGAVTTPLATNLAAAQYDDQSVSLTDATAYSYSVAAHNSVGDSAATNVSATTFSAAPSLTVFAGDTQASMKWLNAGPVDSTTTYTILRATTQAGPYAPVKQAYKATSFTNAGLTPATAYWYEVQSTGASGSSCPSAAVNGTTGAANSAITQLGGAQMYHQILDGTDPADAIYNVSSYSFSAYTYDSSSAAVVRYAGMGTADGFFTIPNVPSGTNYVNVGTGFLRTTTRRFDLSTAYTSRFDSVNASASTPVTIQLSGLAPWNTSGNDNIEGFSINAGFDYYLDGFASTPPAAGATTVSLADNWQGAPLFDGTKGDQLTLTDIANVAGAAPFPYGALQRFCNGTVTPSTMVDGSAATFACASGAAMSTVPSTSTTLHLARSQFKTIALIAGTGPASSAPAAGLDFFAIYATPELATWGYGGGSILPTIVQMNLDSGLTDVTETITYGNPLPSKFGLSYLTDSRVTLSFVAPASAACAAPARLTLRENWVQQDQLSGQLPADITPSILPPTGVSVSLLPALSSGGTGQPVQVSWTAPAGAAHGASIYDVYIYQLGLDASCKTTTTFMGSRGAQGDQTSVVFLPLSSGGTFYAVVRASWLPDEPANYGRPYGIGSSIRYANVGTFSSTFTF